MSSKSKKLEQNIENHERQVRFDCDNCLIGSVMLSVGKLAGKRDKDIYHDFENILQKLPKQDDWSIYTLCEWFSSFYKLKDKYKQRLVLVYDKQNVLTPLVTIMTDDLETGEPKIWPIASDGTLTGILAKPERLGYELIYTT